ncbi:MAG: hypothetical protein GXY71_06390 [Treponema sp.]|nr:hypothetical protein [Treponema sp.]
MRNVATYDALAGERFSSRKRVRLATTRSLKSEGGLEKGKTDSANGPGPKKILLIIESEGAVFDSLSLMHQRAYIPAFSGCFSQGADPTYASMLWRRLALFSRLRGQEPLVILQAALRILNRSYPSVRRIAVLRCLESFLGASGKDRGLLAESEEGSPERLLLDWMTMAETLMEEEGYAPCFENAKSFLTGLSLSASGVEVLVHSVLPENQALNEWEMAELGSSFSRIAGSERGDFASYLRSALKNGFEASPILVVGTTGRAWQAAQSVGSRFYPIVPDAEEESWRFFSEQYFPAFLRGETYRLSQDGNPFMSMMVEDLDACP